MSLSEIKWQLTAERELNLAGTKVTIVYAHGAWPYHVHRLDCCHGVTDSLAAAKSRALEVVGELIEMGVDP